MTAAPGAFRDSGWWPGPTQRGSAAVVVAVNAVVIGQAIAGGWPLGTLLWTYWWQSVLIGVLHMLRLALLRRYDTAGMKRGDGVPIEPSARLPGCMALVFGLHFGLFHLVYAGFLSILAVRFGSGGSAPTAVLALAVGQLVQWFGYLRRDRAGVPSMAAMLIAPYARILPMHLLLISGFWFVGGVVGLLLFGALKTAVEVVSLGLEDRLTARIRRSMEQPEVTA